MWELLVLGSTMFFTQGGTYSYTNCLLSFRLRPALISGMGIVVLPEHFWLAYWVAKLALDD